MHLDSQRVGELTRFYDDLRTTSFVYIATIIAHNTLMHVDLYYFLEGRRSQISNRRNFDPLSHLPPARNSLYVTSARFELQVIHRQSR